MTTPIALSLIPCDRVIIDATTSRRSLIDIFTSLEVADLSEQKEFSLFSRLSNGRGSVKIELLCLDMASGNPIYRQTDTASFPNPLAVINLHVRVRITFPAAGWYEFVLNADGTPITQQKIRIYT